MFQQYTILQQFHRHPPISLLNPFRFALSIFPAFHIVLPRCLTTPAAGTVASTLFAPVRVAVVVRLTGIQIAL